MSSLVGILDFSSCKVEVSIIPFYNGEAIFTQNYQLNKTGISLQKFVRSEFIREGGAIILFVSRLELRTTTILSHNIAINGGGIMAITSTIVCNSTLLISTNSVRRWYLPVPKWDICIYVLWRSNIIWCGWWYQYWYVFQWTKTYTDSSYSIWMLLSIDISY